MPRRPASPFPAPPGTAADRQADGRDPAWFPVRITGGDATAGYTGYEVWRTTSTVEKQGGRTLTDANPGFPLDAATEFAEDDLALARPGPGTGGLEWELWPGPLSADDVGAVTSVTGDVPSGVSSTGGTTPVIGLTDRLCRLARLTTSSGGKWKYYHQKLNNGAYADDGAEATDYDAVPVALDGTNLMTAAAGMRVVLVRNYDATLTAVNWMFVPIGYATNAVPGLLSAAAQDIGGNKRFFNAVNVDGAFQTSTGVFLGGKFTSSLLSDFPLGVQTVGLSIAIAPVSGAGGSLLLLKNISAALASQEALLLHYTGITWDAYGSPTGLTASGGVLYVNSDPVMTGDTLDGGGF